MNAAHTATATNLDTTIVDEALAPSPVPESIHQMMEAMPTEHISMGGDEEEDRHGTISEPKPGKIIERLQLVNRARGIATDLTLFEEGFLKVREQQKKKTTKDYVLNLRYVSSKPSLTRHIAKQTLYVALGLFGTAGASWLVAEFTSLARFFMPAAVVTGTAALIAFLLFVYRTHERIQFSTAHGGAEVLTLFATFGCYRSARKLVPQLIKAANEAKTQRQEVKTYHLRAEMQEHYRLREAGVLTPESCADGTRKILASFG